jgi:hypothetical protein
MRNLLSVSAAFGLLLAAAPAGAQESAVGFPRFFDPRLRCHDAPHLSDVDRVFPGRISVLPGGVCVVRQATRPDAAYQLRGYQVVEPPGEGRLIRQGPTTYAYRAPRGGVGYDGFVVRLIYEGPGGRMLGPELHYEVRIGG